MLFWHILAVCRWYFSFHSRFLSMSIVICEMFNLHIFSLRVWKCMTQIRAGRNKGGRGGASSLDFQTFHPRKSSRVHQTTYGFGSTKRHEVLRGGNFENSYKPHVLKWTQSRYLSALGFWNIEFEKSSLMNWNFCLVWTRFLLPV